MLYPHPQPRLNQTIDPVSGSQESSKNWTLASLQIWGLLKSKFLQAGNTVGNTLYWMPNWMKYYSSLEAVMIKKEASGGNFFFISKEEHPAGSNWLTHLTKLSAWLTLLIYLADLFLANILMAWPNNSLADLHIKSVNNLTHWYMYPQLTCLTNLYIILYSQTQIFFLFFLGHVPNMCPSFSICIIVI